MAEPLQDLSGMHQDLNIASRRVGLGMNLDETKVMFNDQIVPEPVYVDSHADEDDSESMPVITLEVLYDTSSFDSVTKNDLDEDSEETPAVQTQENSGVHFLTERNNDVDPDVTISEVSKPRHELLEYMIRNDGSVLCKLCGEVLKNRTQWYRHKYKLHVAPLNPAPLFQCEHCLVYFKSRKGYVGHIASRHSEMLLDASPVLTNAQLEAANEKYPQKSPREDNAETEREQTNSNTNTTNITKSSTKSSTDVKKVSKSKAEPTTLLEIDEEKRSREEKLVADIINRVRRECEAQGSGGSARRGYSRRTTVMHT